MQRKGNITTSFKEIGCKGGGWNPVQSPALAFVGIVMTLLGLYRVVSWVAKHAYGLMVVWFHLVGPSHTYWTGNMVSRTAALSFGSPSPWWRHWLGERDTTSLMLNIVNWPFTRRSETELYYEVAGNNSVPQVIRH